MNKQLNENMNSPIVKLVQESEVPGLLQLIRPAWQAKDLINRVNRLISVDPSSACQRLFNASIHDLKEKIIIAGIDIAEEAASQHKLPSVSKQEDIENYSTSKIIDLAYRIGFLNRPEWRRLSRCYEIRRDLEHEDDEYEAGIEDCIYIFQTCINVVLAKDPIQLIRVVDVKDLVEAPSPSTPAQSLLEDYESAPQPRQEEILKLLISVAIDDKQSELVRQNAFAFLSHLAPLTINKVTLSLASHLQEKITRQGPTKLLIRVAYASSVLPYLKQAHLRDFFTTTFNIMQQIGYGWRANSSHGELLRSFKDVGGLVFCPAAIRKEILKWLILVYLGEQGGQTSYGNLRHVYYSNTAAPLVEELISDASSVIRVDLRELTKVRSIKRACCTIHIERRLENLLDIIADSTNNS